MDEEELRLKAVEISFRYAGIIAAAVIQHGGMGDLTMVDPFGSVEDIERYIKTGKIPKPEKVIFK